MGVRPPTGFVGRHEQIAVLDGVVRAAHGGEPQLVVIGGEAGVGKTRLVEHLADELDTTGWLVLRGNCVQLGAEGLPLAALTSMLRDLVDRLGADRIAGMLPDAAAALRLLPEYATPGMPLPGRQRLFELIAAMLRRLSDERPVLVFMDDLHWADRSTRQLLVLLARTLRSARVAVLTAFRTDDVGRRHPLQSFLADVSRLPGVHRIELRRFSRADTAELVADVLGRTPSADLVANVFRRSGGNAYFAEELTRADTASGAEPMPDTLRDLLLHRVARLDDDARRVVQAAAVGDPSISYGLLSVTTGRSDDVLLAGLHTAVDARILVAEPRRDSFRFHHALLREAVLDDMLPAERVNLHRVCAKALQDNPMLVGADRLAAETAFHWYGAGEYDRALPALLAAAAAAETMQAYVEQWQFLLRALEVWPHVARQPGTDKLDVWEKAVTAGVWTGEIDHAIDLVERALAETDPTAEPARAAMLHALRAHGLADLGRDGEQARRAALELLPTAPTVQRASVLVTCGGPLLCRDPEESSGLCREAADIAAGLEDEVLETHARITVGVGQAVHGDYQGSLDTLVDVATRARSRDDALLVARVQANIAHVLGALGRYGEACAAAQAGLEAAERAGLTRQIGVILSGNLAEGLCAVGRWDEADAVCAKALDRDPVNIYGAHLWAVRGRIGVVRGDVERARDHERLAVRLLARTGAVDTPVPVSTLRAHLALRDNRIDDARAVVDAARPALTPYVDPTPVWQLLTTGARIEVDGRQRAHTLGDGSTDAGFVDRLRAAAANLPDNTPLFAAYAAQFEAELADAAAGWPAVVAAWDTVDAPYAALYARLRAAEHAIRSGRRGDAEGLLRTAATEARGLGANPLLDEITVMARSAHLALTDSDEDESPQPGKQVPQRLGLTEREVDVLRLVAVGRSNRQIAAQLFISPKTASVHVSRILDKLSVANRSEAAATAHRLRLFDDEAATSEPSATASST